MSRVPPCPCLKGAAVGLNPQRTLHEKLFTAERTSKGDTARPGTLGVGPDSRGPDASVATKGSRSVGGALHKRLPALRRRPR